MEVGDEGSQHCFLLRGAGVGWLTAGVKASLVADADGVVVVVLAMGSYLVFWTTVLDGPVASYDVVVADAFPSFRLMPLVYLRC